MITDSFEKQPAVWAAICGPLQFRKEGGKVTTVLLFNSLSSTHPEMK